MAASNFTSGVEKMKVTRIRNQIWFDGVATVPSACHEVYVEQSVLDIYPPRFSLLQRVRPEAKCAAVETHARFRQGPFHYPSDQKEVAVYIDIGKLQSYSIVDVKLPIDVQVLGFDAKRDAPKADGFDFVTAQGFSSSQPPTIEEAVSDAIAHLPPAADPIIFDELNRYKVLSVSLEVGGVAGLNRFVAEIGTFRKTKKA